MPTFKDSSLKPTFNVTAKDEKGNDRAVSIAGEKALTIKVDAQEIVTLMTIGTHPEALTLGYLRNQRFIESIDDILSIEVNWDTEISEVKTKCGITNLAKRISKRIVTTGCGQGTTFSCTMDAIYKYKLNYGKFAQSTLYSLLKNISLDNEIYRNAGAVHSCALCAGDKSLFFIEDVGRHNAADVIAGLMWLNNVKSDDSFVFYTTGRITSEIVMKVAQIGLATLVSRSGITQMGLELAQDLDMIVISRAKGKHFLLFSGFNRFVFDVIK